MHDLTGRIVLVTGASSGLGEHMARLCAARGARVVLGARRHNRVAAIAAEIGDRALAVELDVTDEASVRAAYDAAENAFGTVDTVIASAGVSAAGRSTEIAVDDFRQVNEVNVIGVFLTAREAARRLIAADGPVAARGRMVLVGSITAHLTGGGMSAYAASKAAVAHLGRNLAREWVRAGISVNVIQPGYIASELAGDWFDTPAGQQQIERFHRKRLQPIDTLDGLVACLCSDAADGITGAVIDIDDGQSL